MSESVANQTAEFFDTYPTRHYAKGTVIVRAGDQPDMAYYLMSGRVKQYDISYQGVEVVVNSFKPNAFFPMSNIMNNVPHDYFFEAENECEVRIAPAGDVIAFVREHPDVLYDLLSRVYRGTDGLLGRLVHLMSGTARHRVLYELMLECRRFGQASADGVILGISETDLAARAGLARETVNREMHKLKAEGLVRLERAQIIVLDAERLADLSGR